MKKTYQLCILFLTFICLTFSCRLCALATQQDTTNEAESDATTSNETDWEFVFTKKKETLKVNKKYTFKTNAPEQEKVTYAVSNKKYASITTNGVLRGKRAGTVTVSATYNDRTIQCKVKIKGKKIIYIDPGHQQYDRKDGLALYLPFLGRRYVCRRLCGHLLPDPLPPRRDGA